MSQRYRAPGSLEPSDEVGEFACRSDERSTVGRRGGTLSVVSLDREVDDAGRDELLEARRRAWETARRMERDPRVIALLGRQRSTAVTSDEEFDKLFDR